ncbi:hypothetical protein U1Q18_022706 [Sarracenia purpurea var. burkii]
MDYSRRLLSISQQRQRLAQEGRHRSDEGGGVRWGSGGASHDKRQAATAAGPTRRRGKASTQPRHTEKQRGSKLRRCRATAAPATGAPGAGHVVAEARRRLEASRRQQLQQRGGGKSHAFMHLLSGIQKY